MRADSRRRPGARPEDRRDEGVQAQPAPARAASDPLSLGGAESGELDRRSVMKLQQSLGNQGVADLLGGRASAGVDQVGAAEQLDEGLRTDMEARFGADFSDVAIHTGREANREARRRNASAYTDGEKIVFDQGTYDPASDRGRELVAHELAHVVQQREGGGAQADRRGMPATDQAAEQEAGEAGRKAARGDGPVEVRQAAMAGATHHAESESPLEGTELSGEQAERVVKVKDAATNEDWAAFETWWREQQDSGPAKVEAEEDGGEQFTQITEALERELHDVFGETSDAIRDIAGQVREANPAGASMLDGLASNLSSSASLNRDEDVPAGLGKVLETMRLFFVIQRIKEKADELRGSDVKDSGPLVASRLDEMLGSFEPMRYRVPDAAVDAAQGALAQVRMGGLFPETGPTMAPVDQDYEQLMLAFEADR